MRIRLRMALRLCILLLAVGLSVQPALAQNRSSILSRLDRIEQRIQELEAQRGLSAGILADTPAGAARYEIAISEMQEDVRALRGQIEEMDYRLGQLREAQRRFEQDADLRLQTLEQRGNASGAATGDHAQPGAPVIEPPQSPGVVRPASPSVPEAGQDISPEAEYKAAFTNLNEGRYEEAEQQFSQFIARYGDHHLIGNAHYWLGETYYVQQRLDEAADEFRKGFQNAPQGPKAPDNLLRLGMTLGVLERRQEACIIFKQLLDKYAGRSQAVERKAIKERDKLGCR